MVTDKIKLEWVDTKNGWDTNIEFSAVMPEPYVFLEQNSKDVKTDQIELDTEDFELVIKSALQVELFRDIILSAVKEGNHE